jgi:hypothetical protein
MGGTDRLGERGYIKASSHNIDGRSHGGEEKPGSRAMLVNNRDV